MLDFRNLCAVKQYRDYRYAALQRRRNLDTHKISRAIQAAISLLVAGIEPMCADHGEQYITLGDFLTQNFDEIHSKGDRVYVHEKEIAAERLHQPIVNAPGMTRAVVVAIADEYFHLMRLQLGGLLIIVKGDQSGYGPSLPPSRAL